MAAGSGAFANPPSFMGVPFSRDLSASRAAIVGVPFDCGTHPVRIGARLGPAAIREQSALVRRYEPPHDDFDPVAALGLVDCGDAVVTPGEMLASYEGIEAAIGHVVEAGAVPMVLGGDGAISLPHMRALHRRHEGLVVLHIDAHTDTYPSYGSSVRDRFNTATTFTRAAEEGLIDPANSYHVGPRGPVYADGVFDFTRQQGYRLIPGEDLFRRGFDDVLSELHRSSSPAACLSLLRHGLLRPILRARGVHAHLGRRIGPRGPGADPVTGGAALRGIRGEHGQPGARCRRHDGIPGGRGGAAVSAAGMQVTGAENLAPIAGHGARSGTMSWLPVATNRASV